MITDITAKNNPILAHESLNRHPLTEQLLIGDDGVVDDGNPFYCGVTIVLEDKSNDAAKV